MEEQIINEAKLKSQTNNENKIETEGYQNVKEEKENIDEDIEEDE